MGIYFINPIPTGYWVRSPPAEITCRIKSNHSMTDCLVQRMARRFFQR